MQLRLVILLLWFGCLDNDVGYIEKSNVIYLNFCYYKVPQKTWAKFVSWNCTSQPLKSPIHWKSFSCWDFTWAKTCLWLRSSNLWSIFHNCCKFFPHCNIVSTFTATLLQSMSRSTNISHQMEYLLATGNLVSRSGLGLMQVRIDKIRRAVERVLEAFFQQQSLVLYLLTVHALRHLSEHGGDNNRSVKKAITITRIMSHPR